MLMDFLGIGSRDEHLEFPVWDSDRQRLAAIPEKSLLRSGQFVCLHPGASVCERRWPAENFAAVVQALVARGMNVVLTGTAAEAELTQRVARQAGVPCIGLAGRTDLGMLAAILGEARLLVCNDTGVSHLAAALKVPSVVISTGNNPERWAPGNQQLHRVLCQETGVAPVAVVNAADELLRSDRVREATVPDHTAMAVFGHNERGFVASKVEADRHCLAASK